MTPNTIFKSLNFNPFILNDFYMIINKTLMSTFFQENVSPLDIDYISPDNFSKNFKDFTENSFSFIHVKLIHYRLI